MTLLANAGALVAVNLLLAAACAGGLLAVGVAVVLDLRERRSWRSMVPPCWPPPGVDPAEAFASDLAVPAPRRVRRPSPARGHLPPGVRS